MSRLATAPTSRWAAAYQMPSDTLTVSAVTVGDTPIQFDTYGDKIYTNASVSEEVVVDYIFRATEATWPSYFTLPVEYSMASLLAVSVARDASLSQLLEQKAQMFMLQARGRDSQRQTTQKLNTSRYMAQRRS